MTARLSGSILTRTNSVSWCSATKASRSAISTRSRALRQEIEAEDIDDVPGALWRRAWLDQARVPHPPADLRRIVVGIDPAASSTESSDETGIVVGGVAADGHGYVLGDYSGRYTPQQWGRKAVDVFQLHGADRFIAEANNGGEMVAHVIKTVWPGAPVRLVHASRGKAARAEPVAALYEQGRIHHAGDFPLLEEQLCTWDPLEGDRSPDRLDSTVWVFTELILEAKRPRIYD